MQLRPDEIRSKRFGQRAQMRPVVGLAAVLTQACASAFAGVWFERVIKQPRADGRGVPSLWTSSLQLCAFSIPLALGALVTHEAKALRDGGPLQGFDRITLLVLLLHVAGGVLVALTLKHADNVVKTFAVSIARLPPGWKSTCGSMRSTATPPCLSWIDCFWFAMAALDSNPAGIRVHAPSVGGPGADVMNSGVRSPGARPGRPA